MSPYSNADFVQCVVARHYEPVHGSSYVSIGNLPFFDISFSDKVTVEVKVDAMAAKTLNAAVEYWDSRRDKPTGILETTAHLWLHCVPEGDKLRCYEIPTKKLLKLCIETGETKPGGDYGSSCLKIIPLQKIREVSNQDFLLEGSLWKP